MSEFKVGELFCGPGGLACGLHMAQEENPNLGQFIPVWANDIDPNACATYQHNIMNKYNPDGIVYEGPVQEIFKNNGVKNLAPIDGLTFGFPCNDYSLIGEQKGLDGDFGPLYRYGVEVLKHHQPQWFIAENVSGLQSANEGKAFQQILQELQHPGGKKGYKITVHLYKFEEYGVPQRRHRVIIVGIREDLPYTFHVPAPFCNESNFLTAQQALENPPISALANNHEFTTHAPKVVQMLRYVPPGENAWSEKIPSELRLNVKGARLSQIYRRLKPNEPAYTLTGSGGGGTHMYHWEEPRALTNRERARIQTFPDDYIFFGQKEAVRKQIGMAVPPKGAKIIGKAILEAFNNIEPKIFVEPQWSLEGAGETLTISKKKPGGLNYWMFPRNKRTLVSLPLVLGAFYSAVNTIWTKDVALRFEEILEKNGIKRPGKRRDQSGSGARTYRAQLLCLGLIFPEKTPEGDVVRFTRAGERMFQGEPPARIVGNQLIKMQIPSSYSIGSSPNINRRFKVHPFRFLLSLLSQPEISYLTQKEIALFVITEGENNSFKCIENVASKILQYRQLGDAIIIQDDFCQLYTDRGGKVQTFEKTFKRLNEVANTAINYLEYSQLAARDEESKLRIVNIKEVQQVLKSSANFRSDPENRESFLRYYGLGPDDTKDTRNFEVINYSVKQPEISLSRTAFWQMAATEPIKASDPNIIKKIAVQTGLSSKTVKEHISIYEGLEDKILFDSYIGLALSSRDEAIEFEKATTKLLGEKGLGFKATHLGGPKKPDIYVDNTSKGSGVVDTKAYASYYITSDHYNRMLHNYIPSYRKKDQEHFKFFIYIAGGFKHTFEKNLNTLALESKSKGIGLTAETLLKLVQAYHTNQQEIQEKFFALIESGKEGKLLAYDDFIN